MPDIFLSYSRDDQATARRFAEGLEHEELTVWWDQTLRSGENYDQVTEAALREAKAVVVLWSKHSVDSRWVRAEATQADRNGTLVPVMIEPCTRPIMFELKQTAELSHWRGDAADARWRAFLGDVRQFVKKEAPASSPVQAVTIPRRQFGMRTMIGVVALLVIVAGVYWFAGRSTTVSSQVAATSATPAKQVTLAVLPFANISNDPAQEAFCDGLTEEILNQLAQIKDLAVIGRTSSFSFKGKNEDLRTIAQKLGVSNLLEGSIRRDGNQLRITAQLINGSSGTHLWSKTYARESKDIFTVQEDIAKDVAQALSIRLDVGDMSRAQGGTTNLEAYEKYLRGNAAYGSSDFANAAQNFREAVAVDPPFARAWNGLYRSLEQIAITGVADPVAARKEMDEASTKIVALAPDAWWTHSMRMTHFVQQRQWVEADSAAQAAQRASASPLNTASSYGVFLEEVGRAREGVEYLQRTARAEPLSRAASGSLQMGLYIAGRTEESAAEYERYQGLPGRPGVGDVIALYRLWSSKDVDTAAVKAVITSRFPPGTDRYGITAANWNDKPAARAALRQAFEDPMNRNPIFFSFADHYGEKDMALASLRQFLIERHGPQLLQLWLPSESNVRADPRFKDIVRELGLVEYWRTTGNWGDFCKPVGKDDFECH